MHMEEALYTREEAAAIFKVGPRTIDRWIKLGALRRIKMPGNAVRIPKSEIDRILHPEPQPEKTEA